MELLCMPTSITEQLWAEIIMYRDSNNLNPFQEICHTCLIFTNYPGLPCDVE